jgi:hypothetical protein
MVATRTARTGIAVPVTIVVVGTVIILVGGLIAWLDPAVLIPAGSWISRGVELYGQRMAARNLALGIVLGALASVRAARELAVAVVVVVLVEIGHTISAIADADWAQASGLLIAVAFAWAAWRLLRRPDGTATDPPSETCV